VEPNTASSGRPAEPVLRRDAAANRERVLAAATAVIKREGTRVPLGVVAAEAGVGVATLYRRYPTREALLAALTTRSFELVLATAIECADTPGRGIDAIRAFLLRTIAHRDQLVLPLHGGPAELDDTMRALQVSIRGALEKIVARGQADGSIRRDAGAFDIVIMGAMLAQPLAHVPDWEVIARRQMDVYLDGLAACPDLT
jgi:AcrR family transcriptional regulator